MTSEVKGTLQKYLVLERENLFTIYNIKTLKKLALNTLSLQKCQGAICGSNKNFTEKAESLAHF